MPFPFTLPTTSAVPLPVFIACPTHPSLPLTASTHRGVLHTTLKKHKKLPTILQGGHLPSVVAAITAYLPYLLAIVDAGRPGSDASDIQIQIRKPLDCIQWRPTLEGPNLLSIGEPPKIWIRTGGLDYEVFFVLATLANAYTLMARAALQPLYDTSAAYLEGQARTAAITTAGRHLRDAAEVYLYLCSRTERLPVDLVPPCPDVAPPTMRALSALALAEAVLLAVLKDDSYPAVVAQDRNKTDKEWMYKAPTIAKVRAHLFARLCIGAAEQVAEASSLCLGAAGQAMSGRIGGALPQYLDDLRRASRAKACRFFAIDAELGGDMGLALGWLRVAFAELDVEPPEGAATKRRGGGLTFGRLRKEWSERREDKRIEKEGMWGLDAGKAEETRVVEMLNDKWSKINDTVS